MVIESLAAENQQQMEVDTNAGSVLRVLVPNSIMVCQMLAL